MNFSEIDLAALENPEALQRILRASASMVAETDAKTVTVQAKRDEKAIREAREQAAMRISVVSDKGARVTYTWTGPGFYAPTIDTPTTLHFEANPTSDHWARAEFASEEELKAFVAEAIGE